MQKIFFNDQYGLTQAVLDGTKTMIRRAVGNHMTNDDIKAYLKGYKNVAYNLAPYKIGEVVAVAQSYGSILNESPDRIKEHVIGYHAGSRAWTNKMFVCASLMPHQILFTDVKVERLQDISDEDCMKEGIYVSDTFTKYGVRNGYSPQCANDSQEKKCWFNSPRDAFAALIDKVSGKGTWERNPYVFAYSFELVY